MNTPVTVVEPGTVRLERLLPGPLERVWAKVRLEFDNSRLSSQVSKGQASVMGGWDVHTGILEDVLNGLEPRPFWSTHARLEREYAAAL